MSTPLYDRLICERYESEFGTGWQMTPRGVPTFTDYRDSAGPVRGAVFGVLAGVGLWLILAGIVFLCVSV